MRATELAGPAIPDRSGTHPSLRPVMADDELAIYGAALAALGWPHGPWSGRFLREFGVVREQLVPLRSRDLLAASFARESIRAGGDLSLEDARATLRWSAVHAAYAMRWLELDPRG
jgi:hypothetical protein